MATPPTVSPPLQALGGGDAVTLICFSHLRWDFVFQRPQHLMSRFARQARILFWEEPRRVDDLEAPRLAVRECGETGVIVAAPELPWGLRGAAEEQAVRALLDAFVGTPPTALIRWYYTPMMLPFSAHLPAQAVVYDCMDALGAFKNAPAELAERESALLAAADLVFTGGYSLYEALAPRHARVQAFPSSVDVAHFAQARGEGIDPADQRALPRPRLGFYGVIDERMDLDLVAALAAARPDWTVVMLGPIAKIRREDLPQAPNLCWLDAKRYGELPDYLRGWDVALMPFALNAATRFISPTKTPEYLAAGKPVVATPITDVVRHYSELEGVKIAQGPEAFIAACDAALALAQGPRDWLRPVDAMLAETSWDATAARMWQAIEGVRRSRIPRPLAGAPRRAAARVPAYDVMVVGAGFAGAVMAERLATDGGKRVIVVDRRPHIAGNAYDRLDAGGVLIHQYGPHIFHTNSEEIFAYLSRFTAWRPYEHRVLASVEGMLVPIPINRTTLNKLYGLSLGSDDEAAAFLASRAEPVESIETSADVVIAAVGRDLYEKFFQGYTRKQWGMDPSALDKSVTARVPTRTNIDDRYFTDRFQAMPRDGYTKMFERMLDHPNIDVLLGTDYQQVRDRYAHGHLVFTGPIDEYFGHRFGKLPYRSLRFRHETLERAWFQPVATVNYPAEDVPYTRITEYKHLTGQDAPRTSLTYEYPSAEGDPYYPIPRAENQALYKRYEALALAEPDVSFVGRLATYRYYNMDQVVGQALATYRRVFTGKKAAATAPEKAAA